MGLAMDLNAARLFVRDIGVAKDFYGRQLGLPLQYDGSAHGVCVFRSGAMTLIVESVAADAPPDDQVLVGRYSGLSFQVASAQQSCDLLRAQGVEFTEAPERQPWGGVLATFRDPSGNALQICEYPADA
jgi:catechol 2,3-dioxygenase-like lactoylglutathione lyase family enzyme